MNLNKEPPEGVRLRINILVILAIKVIWLWSIVSKSEHNKRYAQNELKLFVDLPNSFGYMNIV